jgi:hypothetical protein
MQTHDCERGDAPAAIKRCKLVRCTPQISPIHHAFCSERAAAAIPKTPPGNKSKSFLIAKALANEGKYPHMVELPVPLTGLDRALNRQFMTFLKSGHIRLRLGRSIFGDGTI